MATIYVWSGATGAANGTSWTDAYTTLQAALTAWTVGDVIYVHTGATSTHSESYGSTQQLTAGNATFVSPVPIYGVDKDNSDAYKVSASANFITTGTTDISPNFHHAIYGLQFQAGRRIFWSTEYTRRTFDCHFDTGQGGGSVAYFDWQVAHGGVLEFNRGEWRLDSVGGGNDGYIDVDSGRVVIKDVVIKGSLTGNTLFYNKGSQASYSITELYGCDLSNLAAGTTLVDLGAGNAAVFRFINCKLPSSFIAAVGADRDGHFVEIVNSDDGSTIHRNEIHGLKGSVKTDSAVALAWSEESGGNSVSLSHAMSPSNAQPHAPLRGIPLVSYIDSTGNKTFTVEVLLGDGAGGTSKKLEATVGVSNVGYYQIVPYLGTDTLSGATDNEIWLEVYYLGTVGGPKWDVHSTQVILPGAGSALPAGAGGWTGTTTNNVLYIDPAVTVS